LVPVSLEGIRVGGIGGELNRRYKWAKYIREKTLFSMRRRIIENGLNQIIFEQTGQKLVEAFSVETEKQRIASLQTCSNVRGSSRISVKTM
jgi:hypothetical protein